MSSDFSEKFCCPITKQFFKDPVTLSDGYNYEKSAILTYFEAGNNTSPVTGDKLENLDMIPNESLKQQVKHLLTFDRLDKSSSDDEKEDLSQIQVEIKQEQHDSFKESAQGFRSGTIDPENSEASGMIQKQKSKENDIEREPKSAISELEVNQNQRKYSEPSQKNDLNASKTESPSKKSARSPDKGNYQNGTVIKSEDQFHFANRQDNSTSKSFVKYFLIPFLICVSLLILHLAHFRFLAEYLRMDPNNTTAARSNGLWGLDFAGVGSLCFMAYEVFLLLARNKLSLRRDYVLETMVSVGFCAYPLAEGILIKTLWFNAKEGLALLEFDDMDKYLHYCMITDFICFTVFGIRGLSKLEKVQSIVQKCMKKS